MKVPKVAGSRAVGGVRVGDIFYASWGYDQTNIDFVRVDKVSPTGKTVICRMMSQKLVSSGRGTDRVAPNKPYGSSFRLKVTGEERLRGTYPFARGGTRFGYFWKWKDKPVHQTPIGMGH